MGGMALRVEGRISIKAMELHGEAVDWQSWRVDKQWQKARMIVAMEARRWLISTLSHGSVWDYG